MIPLPETAVGIAHSAFAERFVEVSSGLVDFVEIPFEQLLHNPLSGDLRHKIPTILHCASLSLAGNLPPTDAIVNDVIRWARLLQTPWIGEHLAFVSAVQESERGPGQELAYLDSSPAFNIGYTVSPQYSEETLIRVASAVSLYNRRIGVPILVENGPMYFSMPGSSMSQSSFLSRLCQRCPDVVLLLDLSHLAITSFHYGEDPFQLLQSFPLDRVVEVHLSGIHPEAGSYWDDHSVRAPELVFALCEKLLESHRPKAITLEYNWDASFPADILTEDLRRVRRLLG